MLITVEIDVEGKLEEMLEKANLDTEKIKKVLSDFSTWTEYLDMGTVGEEVEHQAGDAVSSELIQLFLKERPELSEEIEKSDDGWGFE